MIREAVELYRWLWREQLRRRDGAVAPAAGAFAAVVATDLIRMAGLSVARAAESARRRAAGLTGERIAAGAGHAAAATGFCLLLFAPLPVAFLAVQRGDFEVERQGQIQVLGAGLLLLDGVPVLSADLDEALAGRALREVQVTIGRDTPAGALAELREAFEAAELDRVRVWRAEGPPGGVR